ncbi:hypothetical protein QJQ45_025468, partial [Haematococcus lacustris]
SLTITGALTCARQAWPGGLTSQAPSQSPEPVTQPPQRRCSARLAALAHAAPTGPPLPLDCEDPVMLRQLKDFCMFFANPNFKTCYNQLQRRFVRHRHPMLMPAFEDPSNQALLAKLQELCSINLTERFVKLYAKAARAQLGWSGEEAQLFIKMACGYGINANSSELKAATLDKGHVADLIEQANKHRRLLGMKKQGSLKDTLPLPCRMRHAVHVCRWLERWQQPHPPPVPGQPKRGKRRGVGPRTLTCPPPFTLTPMARVGVHFIEVDSRVLHGVCRQLGLTKETRAAFTSEPALSHHWARWFNTNKLRNKEFAFERLVDTDGVSVCVHYTRPLPPPPAPPPAASSSSTNSRPSAAAAAAHEVGLPHIGKGIAEMREFVFDPDTQIGVGIYPGVTQAVSAASGVWDPATGQLMADQLRRWKLTKGQVKHASGLNNARPDTERWLAPVQPHHQHLAAASSAGTSLEANLKHITVTLATWDAVCEVYLDPKWAQQRLRLYGAQDRALEQFFNKLEEDIAEVSMKRHGHAKQLVVFFGAATIGTGGGWGADAVLRACCKVVCRPRGTDQLWGRVVLVDEHRTSRVSSAVHGQQPCEEELDKLSATRPAGWKPPAGQVEQRLVRPAWSQERGQPVRGLMWCPVVAPRKPPQAPRSSQAATQPAASEPGPSTPPPAKRSKPAAEPTKGKGKGKAAKAKPAPQPGRWLDRDCNAALNMQRIGRADQGALPAKGKEYPGLGYKRVRDEPPKVPDPPNPTPPARPPEMKGWVLPPLLLLLLLLLLRLLLLLVPFTSMLDQGHNLKLSSGKQGSDGAPPAPVWQHKRNRDASDSEVDRELDVQPEPSQAQQNKKACGEARWARRKNNTWHAKKYKLHTVITGVRSSIRGGGGGQSLAGGGVNRGNLLRHAVDTSRQLEEAHASWQLDWADWQAVGRQLNTRPYRPPSPFALTPGCSCKAHHFKLDTQAIYGQMRTAGMLPADVTSLPKFRNGVAGPKDSEVSEP